MRMYHHPYPAPFHQRKLVLQCHQYSISRKDIFIQMRCWAVTLFNVLNTAHCVIIIRVELMIEESYYQLGGILFALKCDQPYWLYLLSLISKLLFNGGGGLSLIGAIWSPDPLIRQACSQAPLECLLYFT